MVTNAHVVGNAKVVEVYLHGSAKPTTGRVKTVSTGTDLAVVFVEAEPQEVVPIVSSKSVSIGERVFAVTYPATNILGTKPKYTEGTISSLSGTRDDATMMQISVPVHH